MPTQTPAPGYALAGLNSYADMLSAVTLQAVNPDVVYDQFFNTSPFFAVMRSTEHCRERRGGKWIQEQINISRTTNGAWYIGGGGWQMSTYEGIIALGWDWKFYHSGVVATGPEIMLNADSPEEIVDLVQGRTDVTGMSSADDVSYIVIANNPYGLNSDGTAGNPLAPEGLAVLVDNGTISTTVGGQSRTTYPILNAQVNYANIIGANFLTNLQSLYAATWAGQRSRVSMHLTTAFLFNQIWGSYTPQERYTIDPRILEGMGILRTGGHDLAFNDAPVIIDPKVPGTIFAPGTTSGPQGDLWYMLNLDFFFFDVHPDRFFSFSRWFKDLYGDQYFQDLFLMCALICTRPNKQGVTWVNNS